MPRPRCVNAGTRDARGVGRNAAAVTPLPYVRYVSKESRAPDRTDAPGMEPPAACRELRRAEAGGGICRAPGGLAPAAAGGFLLASPSADGTVRRRIPLVMVLAGLVAMLLSPAAAVAGQSIRYGDVRVQIHDPVHVRTFHGYATYRFTVSNASRQRSHVVRLEFGGRHADELVLSRTVVVEPGRTVGASVRQPAAPIGYGCDVYVDGERQEYAFAGAESGLHRPE